MSAGKGLQEEGMPMRRQRVTHLLWALIGSLGLSLGLSCDAADATGWRARSPAFAARYPGGAEHRSPFGQP